jgi:hypothetical protein
MQRERPPDANHPWRYDETRHEWFYLTNGNHRIYNSTPRTAVAPNVGPVGQYQPDDATLNYPHNATPSSRPIPIRPVPQSGAGRPVTSPNFPGSPQALTGFSPSSQSPGAERFQRQSPSSGPSVGRFSPPTNFSPAGAGRGAGFSPSLDDLRTWPAGRGGGFLPPTNPPPVDDEADEDFVPPADGLEPGQVPSAITQATDDAPELTEVQQELLDTSQ